MFHIQSLFRLQFAKVLTYFFNVSTNYSLDYIFYLLYLLRYLILKAMNFSEEPQQSDIENFYVLWCGTKLHGTRGEINDRIMFGQMPQNASNCILHSAGYARSAFQFIGRCLIPMCNIINFHTDLIPIRLITCFSSVMMISLDHENKMGDYLINNQPFCSDDSIRSYRIVRSQKSR